jgi:hypothetical protein
MIPVSFCYEKLTGDVYLKHSLKFTISHFVLLLPLPRFQLIHKLPSRPPVYKCGDYRTKLDPWLLKSMIRPPRPRLVTPSFPSKANRPLSHDLLRLFRSIVKVKKPVTCGSFSHKVATVVTDRPHQYVLTKSEYWRGFTKNSSESANFIHFYLLWQRLYSLSDKLMLLMSTWVKWRKKS